MRTAPRHLEASCATSSTSGRHTTPCPRLYRAQSASKRPALPTLEKSPCRWCCMRGSSWKSPRTRNRRGPPFSQSRPCCAAPTRAWASHAPLCCACASLASAIVALCTLCLGMRRLEEGVPAHPAGPADRTGPEAPACTPQACSTNNPRYRRTAPEPARLLAPPSSAQARQFIAGYARAPASTVGSVVLTDLATGRSWEGVDVAEVGACSGLLCPFALNSRRGGVQLGGVAWT